MSSLSSLTKAVSGLTAAQKGLQVTGHNISNANTKGYIRQQLLQSDSAYLTIGKNGGYSMQVGLGVTPDEIRQIRDELADKRLRTENSVLCYYQKLNGAVADIESIFDEPYGDTISDFLNSFWSQTQKLSASADGVEERQSFISSAKVLMSKINEVSNSLSNYQDKLNSDITSSVKRVNQIFEDIRTYNEKISKAEALGDNANDYRDQRNLLLDELSNYGDISYFEEADGQVQVKFEGHTVINKGFEIKIELSDIKGSPYSKPTWSDSKDDVFDLKSISSASQGNDSGSIKAMLIARGDNVVTGSTTWDDIALNDNFSVEVTGNAYVIPKIQKMLGEFTNQLVELVNSSFTGTGIGSHKGQAGVTVFVPITISDAVKAEVATLETAVTNANSAVKVAQEKVDNLPEGHPDRIQAEEDLANAQTEASKAKKAYDEKMKTILVPGNIQVNPELLEGGGYNKLGTVARAEDGSDSNADNASDNTLINNFLTEWGVSRNWFNDESSASSPYAKVTTITGFFSELVTDIGSEGAIYTAKASEKNIGVINIENERQAMGGVSTDEEFSNMLKYQYAYNASARMITMLDGMLDTIINKM